MKPKIKSFVRLFLIMLIGTFALNTFAQPDKDDSTVIETCLWVAEMQQQNHLGPDGQLLLVLENNGVIPLNESLNWFDNPVEYITDDVIKQENINAYVSFELFQVEDDKAAVNFIYRANEKMAARFSLNFIKADDHWFITANKTEKISAE